MGATGTGAEAAAATGTTSLQNNRMANRLIRRRQSQTQATGLTTTMRKDTEATDATELASRRLMRWTSSSSHRAPPGELGVPAQSMLSLPPLGGKTTEH